MEMPKSEVDELQGHGSRQRPHQTLGWRMVSTSCQPSVANCWPLAAHGCCRPLAARVNLGIAKVVLPQETAIPQPPRNTSEFRLGGCSFLPNIGGATQVDMTSTGRGQNVLQDQDPTHQTAIILPDIGAKLPAKSGLVASNLAIGSKNGRRRPSLPSWRPNAPDD